MGKPVVGLQTWELGDRAEGVTPVDTVDEAVGRAFELLS
jgi:hypothetical protein